MVKKINIEDIFLTALGSAKKLKWYLQYNVDLFNYLNAEWPQWFAIVDLTFAFIPRKKRKEMFGDISSARILKVLEKERPDLYKIINTKKGIDWLEKQIKGFEERFL